MWICLCKAVTDGDVERAIDGGATTVVDIGRTCGAGTDCAMCTRTIALLIKHRRHERRGERAVRDRRIAWWTTDDG